MTVGWACDVEVGEAPEAPARTFGFEYELDQMRNMGLIRGASLDNAVCFDRRSILNKGRMRFENECCRHKALDMIGDLALIGKPLLGHVIAEKAGHAMHFALDVEWPVVMSWPGKFTDHQSELDGDFEASCANRGGRRTPLHSTPLTHTKIQT